MGSAQAEKKRRRRKKISSNILEVSHLGVEPSFPFFFSFFFQKSNPKKKKKIQSVLWASFTTASPNQQYGS